MKWEQCSKNELYSYLPTVFDSSLMLLQPNKPVLADAIWALTMESSDVSFSQGNLQFVLDGGALIYQTPWPWWSTYRNICALYCNYVDQKYGQTIKDIHKENVTAKACRRREGRCDRHIYWRHETYNEEGLLLANKSKKQSFINMLIRYLQQANCQVYHSTADADALIVNKAVHSSRTMDTVLGGDDTDLFILLCYHAEVDVLNLFSNQNQKQIPSVDSAI